MTEINTLLGLETISETLFRNIPVLHLEIETDESIYEYEYLFKVHLKSIHGDRDYVVFKNKGSIYLSTYISNCHKHMTVEEYVQSYYYSGMLHYQFKDFNRDIAAQVIKDYLQFVDETEKHLRFYKHIENLKQVLVG
jgi:hypothetical protein